MGVRIKKSNERDRDERERKNLQIYKWRGKKNDLWIKNQAKNAGR